MNIRSILALTDFSPGAERALERAALVAADHRALLRIASLGHARHRRQADDFARLSQRATELSAEHGAEVRASQAPVTSAAELAEQTGRADLLVIDGLADHRFGGPWRSASLPRILARSARPVLVARNASPLPYARTLLAFDPSVDSGKLLRYGSDFEIESGLEVLRIEKRRSSAETPRKRISRSLVARSVRGGRRCNGNRSFRLSDPLENRRSRLLAALGQVDAVAQIRNEQDFNRADLVIAARQPAGWIETLLRGDFAARLGRELRCDLLLVPQDFLERAIESQAGLAPAPGRERAPHPWPIRARLAEKA